MKTLVAFPDTPYYNWQVLVQINNLVKFGFSDDMVYIVGKQPKRRLSWGYSHEANQSLSVSDIQAPPTLAYRTIW